MEVKTLYRYEREGGGVTVTPIKPDCEYTELYRLIADEGYELVKGDIHTCCIDVDNTEGWEEVELPPEEETEEEEEKGIE